MSLFSMMVVTHNQHASDMHVGGPRIPRASLALFSGETSVVPGVYVPNLSTASCDIRPVLNSGNCVPNGSRRAPSQTARGVGSR